MSPLYGIVACGGQSSRMGKDKSLLDYHGRPQRDYLYEMLGPLCEKVFFSCSREQAAAVAPVYSLITDEDHYAGIGPLASLLSAFGKFPSASFLVVGCDYPFVTRDHLQQLVAARTEKKDAVCFRNPETSFDEPLLAVYENSIHRALLENFHFKKYSLRHFLSEANTLALTPSSADFLKSIDDDEGYKKARQALLPPFQ